MAPPFDDAIETPGPDPSRHRAGQAGESFQGDEVKEGIQQRQLLLGWP
jgi:hypothetical protein